MKMKNLFFVLIVIGCGCAHAQIAKVYQWESIVEDGTTFGVAPTRGETMIMQPRIMSYGQPMDLSGAWTVTMYYKPIVTNGVSTNVYGVSGSVIDGEDGQIEVQFGSSNEMAATTYAYDILVSGPNSTVVAARGAIKYRDGVAYNAQLSTNEPIYILDFDKVQILNIGEAPWLSSYELEDIRDYLTEIQTGIGNIDASNVVVRGQLTHPIVNASLTNLTVSGYGSLTRTGPHSASITITGDGGGGGGGVGTYTNTIINGVANTSMVAIADGSNLTWSAGTDGVWRANSAIPQSWSSTGTLYWVINGETIGHVDTNGIKLTRTNTYFDGPLIGSLENATNYPEPIFTNWLSVTGTRARYYDVGDGTVEDIQTGLFWMKNANTIGGPTNWHAATNYIAGLNAAKYLGYSDWRLPSVYKQDGAGGPMGLPELETIGRPAGVYPNTPFVSPGAPFIGVININTADGYYWASTANGTVIQDLAWVVQMHDGALGVVNRGWLYYVWPVRGGLPITKTDVAIVSKDIDLNGHTISNGVFNGTGSITAGLASVSYVTSAINVATGSMVVAEADPVAATNNVPISRTVTVNGTAGTLTSNLNFTIAAGGGNVASVTGAGGLTNTAGTTGAVTIALSAGSVASLAKADAALTNAAAFATAAQGQDATNALAQVDTETNEARVAEAALGLRIDDVTNGAALGLTAVQQASTSGWTVVSHAGLASEPYVTNAISNAVGGLVVVESDPIFTNWGRTNTYVKAESDPVFTNWATTNGYVKLESDPAFTNWSATNEYAKLFVNGGMNYLFDIDAIGEKGAGDNGQAYIDFLGLDLGTIGTNGEVPGTNANWTMNGNPIMTNEPLFMANSNNYWKTNEAVPFNIYTNSAAPYTNPVVAEAFAFQQGVGLKRTWSVVTNGEVVAVTTAGFDTNYFDITTNGGIVVNSPMSLNVEGNAGNSVPSKDWVRNALETGNPIYQTTNKTIAFPFIPPTNATYWGSSEVPADDVISVPTTSNKAYVLTMVSTNVFLAGTVLKGPATVTAYLNRTDDGPADVLTLHPEIYYFYTNDHGTILGDFSSGAQDIPLSTTVTNPKTWSIAYNDVTLVSNAYVFGRMKIDSRNNAINLFMGLGTNLPSHISFPAPDTSSLGARGATNATTSTGSATGSYNDVTRVITLPAIAGGSGADQSPITNNIYAAGYAITNADRFSATNLAGFKLLSNGGGVQFTNAVSARILYWDGTNFASRAP